jgi:hypothetical protein
MRSEKFSFHKVYRAVMFCKPFGGEDSCAFEGVNRRDEAFNKVKFPCPC